MQYKCCIQLHCIVYVLYCIVLYCTVLYCIALYCIILYCNATIHRIWNHYNSPYVKSRIVIVVYGLAHKLILTTNSGCCVIASHYTTSLLAHPTNDQLLYPKWIRCLELLYRFYQQVLHLLTRNVLFIWLLFLCSQYLKTFIMATYYSFFIHINLSRVIIGNTCTSFPNKRPSLRSLHIVALYCIAVNIIALHC